MMTSIDSLSGFKALMASRDQLAGEQQVLHQAQEAAAGIGDKGVRASVLAAVAGQLGGEPQLSSYSDFARVIDGMSISRRQDWLVLSQALLPFLDMLGGETAMGEVGGCDPRHGSLVAVTGEFELGKPRMTLAKA